MPVRNRTYGSAVNEIRALREKVEDTERDLREVSGANGRLAARVDELEAQLAAANDAAQGLREALNAGAAKSTPASPERQQELAAAREQIARQDTALAAYERDHQGLLDDLRRLAEERDTALATIERMSRNGAWTPEGVTS